MSDNPFQEEPQKLPALLKAPAYANRFKEVLGERAAQFCSSLISIGNSMPDVEPKSIIGAAMTAAVLDLPIDKNLGFAWIVPYKRGGKRYAQFQMGSRGYVQLALRSSQYTRMNSVPINREVFNGYDAVGEPQLDWEQFDPTKEVWGYFFGFQLVNGFVKKAVWTKERVKEHARRFSQAYRSDADIWREHFDGMAEKTVVSNTLRKWGPLSIQLQQAVSADQSIISDLDAQPMHPEIEDAMEKPEIIHPAHKEQAPNNGPLTPEAPVEEPEPAQEPPEAPEPPSEPTPEPEPVPEPISAKQEPKPEPKVEPKVGVKVKARSRLEQMAMESAEPKPKNVVQMPATEPANVMERKTPPAEAPKKKELTESQVQLRDGCTQRGHSFEELREWAVAAIQLKPFPEDWADIANVTATYLVSKIAKVDEGIRKLKEKKGILVKK